MLLLVIPGLTRNPVIFKWSRNWMPDQVRHDGQILIVIWNKLDLLTLRIYN